MMYQRPDYTSYFSNTRWDDGLWRMDGAVLGFNFGGAKLDVMAGKVSTPTSVNGNPINPMVTQNTYVSTFDPMAVSPGAGFMVDRVMGVNLNVPLTTNGNLNLAYLWLNNDDPTIVSGGSNRVEVYGGNAEFNVGRVKLEGGWSASNVKSNDTTINDDENNAWYARLGWTGDRYGFFAGYRRVEDRYIAPGDWGRVGIIRNPANLQGFQVGANIDLTGSLSLNGSAEILEGISNTAFNPYFNADTEVQRYVVNLGYQLNPNLMLNVGHEYNRIEGQNQFGGWPARYAWWSFGVGYGLSQAAKLTIQYEISDVSGEFTGVNPNGPTGTSTIFRGGFLTTQLSVKF